MKAGTPPSVSVVMAVYNGERFLADTLDSLLTQSLRDFEVVVVDDGSTDRTAGLLHGYASRDRRVIVQRQRNLGRAAARNVGIGLARAPLVALIDADDIAMPDRLERQRRFLAENPKVAGVGGSLIFINDQGREFAEVSYPLSPPEVRAAFSQRRTGIAHPAAMVRKQVLNRIGGYRSTFVRAEDADLWLRILDDHCLANLDAPVLRYRIHRTQAAVDGLEQQALCCVAAHVAARARSSGLPDPFDSLDRIDVDSVIAHGGTVAEITAYFVESATWIAKTTGRAGYAEVAETFFRDAEAKARSTDGSPMLVAMVLAGRAARDREQGKPLRARVRGMHAKLAQREYRAGRRRASRADNGSARRFGNG
jgi:glycosyltransferase involved in cell wall biosynthesis